LIDELFLTEPYRHQGRLSILAGESGVQGLPPLTEREVSSQYPSFKITRKDREPAINHTIITNTVINRFFELRCFGQIYK
jgi:hypothetical protein